VGEIREGEIPADNTTQLSRAENVVKSKLSPLWLIQQQSIIPLPASGKRDRRKKGRYAVPNVTFSSLVGLVLKARPEGKIREGESPADDKT
jgi:hypothetical protein